MAPYKEKEIEKKYFTISEVAEMFDVTASLIRFWETEFDTLKPQKNKKGNRQYTNKDIEQLRIIYTLVKENGYTLAGAKEKIKLNPNKVKEEIDVLASLQKVRNFLVELKNHLD
jgi:DNA-binding transcriptional MerR regulator